MVGLCSVGKTFLKKNTVPIHMGSLESALRLPRRLGLHARTLIFLRWMTHIQILTANSFEYKHMQFGMIEPRNGHGSNLSFNKGDINHNLNAFWIGQMRCLQTVREGPNKKTTLIGPNSSLWIITEFQVRPFFGCYLRTWFIIIRTYISFRAFLQAAQMESRFMKLFGLLLVTGLACMSDINMLPDSGPP